MQDSSNMLAYIDVLYYPNGTFYGATAARLVVTNDKRLVLTSAEGTPEAPVYKEIFNVTAGEVRKISLMVDQLTVKLTGKTHRMSVSQYMVPALAAGGIVGGAVAYGMEKKSGAAKFVAVLRSLGIPVSHMGIGKLYGISALIALALIAAIALGVYLFGGAS